MSIDAALLVLGAATLGLGLMSDALKRVWLSLPLAALAVGVVLGPEVLGMFDPARWFGPLGVAAVYYATFVEQYGPSHYDTIFGASTLAIVVSVLMHSVSATPAVRRHAGRSPLTTFVHPLRPGTNEAP